MQPTKDLLNKGVSKVKAIHDSTHETCHIRLQQKMVLSSTRPPTPLDVLRYRYHHGVNLGSCFVLEKWLRPSMFPQGADTSELAAITASVDVVGVDATRQKWESNWANMLSDADLDWLVNIAHCTSIRLPVGYWVLGPIYSKGTPFAAFAPVYTNAFTAIKNIVDRAYARGVGTLIDFHALPGGANGGDHSGTNSGKAELWGNNLNLDLATHCVHTFAQNLTHMEGVIGLQLCNEALYNAPGMYAWYDRVLQMTAQVDPNLPLYISDAWNLPAAISYIQTKNTVSSANTNPLIIDTHYYWAFSAADTAKSPSQIIREVPSKLNELGGHDGDVVNRGAAQVVVGEYSCVMADSSWSKASAADRPQLTSQFGLAQSTRWQQRSGGCYFWTYKMDWMDGGEWGFVEQTKTNAITPPPNLALATADVQGRVAAAQSQRASKRAAAISSNKAYWDAAAPGQTFEHWRFETGWDLGFTDALSFFSMRSSGRLGKLSGIGGDKIGCLDMWVRKRILDSGMAGGFVWEFEHGFRQGVQGFHDAARL